MPSPADRQAAFQRLAMTKRRKKRRAAAARRSVPNVNVTIHNNVGGDRSRYGPSPG